MGKPQFSILIVIALISPCKRAAVAWLDGEMTFLQVKDRRQEYPHPRAAQLLERETGLEPATLSLEG